MLMSSLLRLPWCHRTRRHPLPAAASSLITCHLTQGNSYSLLVCYRCISDNCCRASLYQYRTGIIDLLSNECKRKGKCVFWLLLSSYFIETHKTVLNQILRQSQTPLSDSPFSVLVDHMRLLDFDVKLRYFRAELQKLDEGDWTFSDAPCLLELISLLLLLFQECVVKTLPSMSLVIECSRIPSVNYSGAPLTNGNIDSILSSRVSLPPFRSS